ncbi:NAD(P)/FAD-dependent oxidoreductase [Elioraea thermophila]|uniref:NAD(P)/FAD-dependent oxidoreductase n=1 Tax=Elioraea thermophila TaxID=2185104 RepID=UPI000DF2AEC8|nr:FAD-binding oxidoreductase [Elioraea thermophila]
MSERVDIVIVGGAAVGASTAWHLACWYGAETRIVVIEKDPSYARAATALSASSIRRQFSAAINVRVSGYGVALLRAAPRLFGFDPTFREGGYLFLATEAGRAALTANHATALAEGADIAWLETADLAARFPWLNTEGIAAGTFGRSGEGWFDGFGLAQAMRARSREAGVAWRTGEVAAIDTEGERVRGVVLADGERIAAARVIVCAGCDTPALLAPFLAVPVRRRKRMIFFLRCPDPLAGLPLLIDPSGAYLRPEGEGFICGASPPPDEDPDVAAEDFDLIDGFFEERVWAPIAARVPALERIRLERAWAGHYDFNTFDHNALIGPIPGVSGLFAACGFSGHGLQQAPSTGRGLAELALWGRYVAMDLSPLGFDRLADGRRVEERAVV